MVEIFHYKTNEACIFLQYGIIRIKLFFISKDLCINDVIGKVYFFSSLECEVNSDE